MQMKRLHCECNKSRQINTSVNCIRLYRSYAVICKTQLGKITRTKELRKTGDGKPMQMWTAYPELKLQRLSYMQSSPKCKHLMQSCSFLRRSMCSLQMSRNKDHAINHKSFLKMGVIIKKHPRMTIRHKENPEYKFTHTHTLIDIRDI